MHAALHCKPHEMMKKVLYKPRLTIE